MITWNMAPQISWHLSLTSFKTDFPSKSQAKWMHCEGEQHEQLWVVEHFILWMRRVRQHRRRKRIPRNYDVLSLLHRWPVRYGINNLGIQSYHLLNRISLVHFLHFVQIETRVWLFVPRQGLNELSHQPQKQGPSKQLRCGSTVKWQQQQEENR